MKKLNNNILIIIGSIFIILIILLIYLISSNSKDKYYNIKNSIEKVFFYLENDEYKSMNDMSDFCKIALIYDSPYMKKEKTKRYSTSKVISILKKVLGPSINFNVSLNEMDSYNFLVSDSCIYGNVELNNLSYDSLRKEIYIDMDSKQKEVPNNYYLQVKWEKPIENGNLIILKAKALLIEKKDNSYIVYVDFNKLESLGEYNSLQEAKKNAEKSMNYSIDYVFNLEKIGDDVVWKSFKRNRVSSDMIID